MRSKRSQTRLLAIEWSETTLWGGTLNPFRGNGWGSHSQQQASRMVFYLDYKPKAHSSLSWAKNMGLCRTYRSLIQLSTDWCSPSLPSSCQLSHFHSPRSFKQISLARVTEQGASIRHVERWETYKIQKRTEIRDGSGANREYPPQSPLRTKIT